jgi:nitroreductase
MPDALQLMATRRSVKPFEMTGPGPTAAEIDTLLTVASRVPDHGKLAPWRFILFEGEGQRKAARLIEQGYRRRFPNATDEQVTDAGRRFSQAPLVVAVISRPAPHPRVPEWEQVLSAGASTMNLVIASHAMGYAACWLTDWVSYDDAVLKELGVMPGEKVAGFVHIGRAAQTTEDRPRPALADIVTRFA